MNSTALTATVQPNLDVNYIGMDVHSDNVVVCVRRNTINSSGQLVGKTIKTKKVVIKSSQEPLVELLSKYADGQQHIMTAESTFNWYWLADIAEDHGWNFRLADPCTVSQANIKATNDETDAEYLADRLRTGSLKSTSVLPRKLRGVRDLMRHRLRVMQEVSEKKVRLSNLYHNHCAHPMHGKLLTALQDAYDEISVDAVLESGICNNGSAWIIGDLLTGLREAEARLAKIEAAVYERIDEVDEYKAERLLLKTSMKGCGDVLSAIIVTEIGDISRFRTMGDFVSYCRLAPTSKLSNGKSKGQGNAKNGNAYLSWALTGLRVVAVRALAAKLARCVYQVLRKNESFDLALAFDGKPTRAPTAIAEKPATEVVQSPQEPEVPPITAAPEPRLQVPLTEAPIVVKEPSPVKAKRGARTKAVSPASPAPAVNAEGRQTARKADRVKARCALTATPPSCAGTSCVKSRRE